MTRRGQHLLEMRTAMERGCSLPEARAHLAALRHRAAIEALNATRRSTAMPAKPPIAAPKFWWKDQD